MARRTSEPFILLSLILAALALVGCSRMTEGQVNDVARRFIDRNVVFYTGENISNMVGYERTVDIVSTERRGESWEVAVHVHSNATGEEKKKGLVVFIDDATGKVTKMEKFDI